MSTSLTDASGPAPGRPASTGHGGSGRRGRRTRGRTSPFTVIGIGLLIAGLACLGWVAYQYFGTNVVSQKAFETQREELKSSWAADEKASPTKQPEPKAGNPLPGEATALLRIPAFGDDYEIPVLTGTTLDILSDGVGHYTSTAQAGQIGNFALAGHRVTHGEPFSRLLELDQGDEIVVETRDAIYTYVMDEAPRQLTVRDTDTWVLDPVPGKPDTKPSQALITLTTCQDLFRSPDRSIGFGHLESTKNK